MTTRRTLIATGLAAGTIGAAGILPRAANAAAHGGDMVPTKSGEIAVHPVQHASLVMETPAGVVYADPVGGAELYADLPAPGLILITHEHGDHLDVPTLEALMGPDTLLVSNPGAADKMPEALKSRAMVLANGESAEAMGIAIEAIPAYNTTEDRKQYHPEGRDNGYVLTIDGTRIYIAGDTEGTPEMRALKDIALAFVPMNLPYTMDTDAAAEAVAEFAPTVVYPYHYKGQEPQDFADAKLRRAFDGGGDHGLGVRGRFEQQTPGAALGDFGHRTAHVDVNGIGPRGGDDGGGFAHDVGFGAEQLHGDGPLFLGKPGQRTRFLLRLFAAANQRGRGHKFRPTHARAIATAQAAKRLRRDAGHRRQHDGRIHDDITVDEERGKHGLNRTVAPGATFRSEMSRRVAGSIEREPQRG